MSLSDQRVLISFPCLFHIPGSVHFSVSFHEAGEAEAFTLLIVEVCVRVLEPSVFVTWLHSNLPALYVFCMLLTIHSQYTVLYIMVYLIEWNKNSDVMSSQR